MHRAQNAFRRVRFCENCADTQRAQLRHAAFNIEAASDAALFIKTALGGSNRAGFSGPAHHQFERNKGRKREHADNREDWNVAERLDRAAGEQV